MLLSNNYRDWDLLDVKLRAYFWSACTEETRKYSLSFTLRELGSSPLLLTNSQG